MGKNEKKRLKILYLVDEMPSVSTPFILNQIIGMIERGHHVEILSRTIGDLKTVHEEVEEYRILEKTNYLDPIPERIISRVGYFSRNLIPSLFSNPNKTFASLNYFSFGRDALSLRLFHEFNSLRRITFPDFDVIHAQFGPLGKMGMRLRSLGIIKGKLITQFRGYDVSKLLRYEKANYYDDLFEKGDFFLANSMFFREKAIALGAPHDRIEVQYSGVLIDKFLHVREFPVFLKSDKISFGSVGRLSGKKGYEFCIKAMGQLKSEGFRFTYEIIGEGELRRDLEALIDKLELNEEVRLLGAMPHSKIANHLKGFDAFLSHNVTSDEGDQDAPVNTLKEAMLAGCICFSTFHGGIPELIVPDVNGYLSEERNVDRLAKLIEDKLYNSEKLSEISFNARTKVMKEFSNHALNEQLEARYLRLC